MIPFFLAEGGHAGHGIAPLDATPENFKAALWAFGIVLALFIVLGKFAWGPLVRGLQAREDKINASLARAEELEKATRELQATLAAERAKAQQEAQQIVADSRVSAKNAAAEIMAKMQAEIEASKERHQRELALEADKIRAELRREAVDLTLLATAKVLGQALTAADHRRLVEESLRDAESVARN